MSEEINGRKIFSLHEVACSIQKTIAERYKSAYWIKAELNKLNHYPQSGHCYPELVEKKDGKVIAQMRCNLWRDDYKKIDYSFQRTMNEPLKDGIKILFLATIGYHPEHGLSLRILDIDPTFTLGDLEREKQETIKRLQQEGIYNKNRSLKIPMLPQRIAIISVQTSKGYSDFLRVFEAAHQSWGYKFFHLLFPSLLQGDKAVHAIIHQLRRIKQVIHHFDVVAIVRGGGGDIGLSCYNHYELAKEIASFPIPVITGIGHSTNETVSEMIAFENAITPTKLAEFLIQKFHNFSVPLQKAEEKIIDKSRRLIAEETARFQSEVKLFKSVTQNLLLQNKNALKANAQSLVQQSQFAFKNRKDHLEMLKQSLIRSASVSCHSSREKLLQLGQSMRKDALSHLRQQSFLLNHRMQQMENGTKIIFRSQSVEIQNIEKNIHNMDPKNVLMRGYSITLLNGKSVKNFQTVKEGDTLKTVLFEGSITSSVNSTSKSSNHE